MRCACDSSRAEGASRREAIIVAVALAAAGSCAENKTHDLGFAMKQAHFDEASINFVPEECSGV
jgi:hypothetical protein